MATCCICSMNRTQAVGNSHARHDQYITAYTRIKSAFESSHLWLVVCDDECALLLQKKDLRFGNADGFLSGIISKMKKHGSKPGQAVFMGYPHIRGTVVAAEWQPSFIYLWPGIGCPDFCVLLRIPHPLPPSLPSNILMPTALSLWAFLRPVRDPAAAARHPFLRFADNQIS